MFPAWNGHCLWGLVLFWLCFLPQADIYRQQPRCPLRIIFQILYRALLLLAALAGSILFFIALFTNHTVAHGNWNLLLLNPLHWISLIAPYRIQQTEKQQFRAGFLLYLPWIITISTSILLWTLYLTGILNQDITQTAAFLLPVAVSVSCPWLKKVLMP